jgi:RNA-directed DNA polymerase
MLTTFAEKPSHLSVEMLAQFLDRDDGWFNLVQQQQPLLYQIFWVTPEMSPQGEAPTAWQAPALTTTTALANFFGLRPKQLDWFADCHGHEAQQSAGALRHYTYQRLAKKAGRFRLLEIPKPRLKAIQRRLLHEILDRIPPHAAVHGFRRGCSVLTYVAPHAGQAMVLHFDLQDFFPSVRSSRIHALFRTAGYPVPVARLLTGLCTNSTPPEERAFGDRVRDEMYRSPHLPQGAPTSPALANLCAYLLDCRLAGLAESIGANYSRYADDLAFSGDERLERCARRFQVAVCRIALEEGFTLQTRKSRFMRQGVRQQLAGVVVNAHPNVRREEHDRLKAILCNCVRHGPTSQNRDGHADFRSHLAGRIAYVAMLNPPRGARLRAWFDRIRWDEER